jgi:hypothetical protein
MKSPAANLRDFLINNPEDRDNMERYMELHQAGIAMLAIPYSSWKRDAPRTAVSMPDHCGCGPGNLTAIEETLAKEA